jgi:3-methyladenine DNA glycosylase/8-oxoguanine DNA glycosylase
MEESLIDVGSPFDLFATARTLVVGRRTADVWVWASWTSAGLGTVEVSRATESVVRMRAWGDGASMLLERGTDLVGANDTGWGDNPPADLRDLAAGTLGLRLGANGSVYETVAQTVLGQLVTTREAKRSLRDLTAAFGDAAPGSVSGLKAFPRAAVLAQLAYQDLHPLGIERKRAETLIEVARRANRLEGILGMSPGDAERRLLAVKGIGPWTAGIAMGAAFGNADAVPEGDYHLPNAIAWALAGEPRADDERMHELLEPFRPQRRRVVEMIKQAGIHAPKYGPRSRTRQHL